MPAPCTQRKGDNLYTSVIALGVESAKIKGHHQYQHNDAWDRDEVSAPLLIDTTFKGKPVKGLVHAGRSGYLWMLERTADKVNYVEAWPCRKAPFKLRGIWALRVRLQMENRVRELALFNLGIDSKLRGCDLVSLRARDICLGEQVEEVHEQAVDPPLSTADHHMVGFHPRVNIESAGWVNIGSARTRPRNKQRCCSTRWP